MLYCIIRLFDSCPLFTSPLPFGEGGESVGGGGIKTMLRFDIITIFPEIFNSYFQESIIKRAQEKKKIRIYVHNLRDFTEDKHKTVDDRPYGGGPGMILRVDIIYKAVKRISSRCKNIKPKERRIVLFSAKGKSFNQKTAEKWKKYKQIILICGRYEGVDERVAKYIADEETSIGSYVLTGGELPAMVVIDAVTRLLPGVIRKESLEQETFSSSKGEYPQYTRPEVFETNKKLKDWRVPKVLLSGNHKKVGDWRQKHSKY